MVILGEIMNSIKKKHRSLVVISKEFGLVVNAANTVYVFMCRAQNEGQKSHHKCRW